MKSCLLWGCGVRVRFSRDQNTLFKFQTPPVTPDILGRACGDPSISVSMFSSLSKFGKWTAGITATMLI
jgi:hypothetical protein